ncbi:zinc finger protein 599-like [Xiphias gladius]|uniref:zinc finger protein 599-like n=1 Tax=Xiphias gladius TaxID=8245 RepID=UPI001A99C6C5|nr:zinc finger protein 599-like [Xiphias gladius]
MSQVQMLRAAVKRRTTGERPYSGLHVCPADVQQLLVRKEVSSEQREWSPSLDQEDPPEPPHIKEEQEELWTGQEGEQLQGLEEADITKFPFLPVPVKSEDDDEEKPHSSQLHQTQKEKNREAEPPSSSSAEHMETEADGEDCGGPEPARNSDPDRHLQPDADDKALDSSETDVSDDDWTKTRETQSGLNSVKNKARNTDKGSFTCSECGKTFGHKTNLKRHVKCHTGEKPFSCSFCNKSFNRREHLIAHIRCHSGEKPFSCTVCSTSFSHSWSLDKHMRVHTGEKPFCCSLCSKRFRQRSDLVAHFRIHTGEKPFSCSVCNTSFTQRHTLVQHMRTHTGVKPFVCSVCGKRFSRKGHMTRHMTAHTGEKPFNCTVCDKRFTWQSQFKRHECAGQSSGTKGSLEVEVLSPPETDTSVAEDHGGPEPDQFEPLAPDPKQRPVVSVASGSPALNEKVPPRTPLRFFRTARTSPRRPRSVAASPPLSAYIPSNNKKWIISLEEVSAEQQEWSPSLDQEDPPEPPHIKEEPEELWTGQEGEQLQGLEEADNTKFPFLPVPVKSEDDDEEKPQSSQLHQNQMEENREAEPPASSSTEQMESEADGEDCGGPEPARNSDPEGHLQPDGDKTSDSSEPDTDDSEDWKETRERQSGLNAGQINPCRKEDSVSSVVWYSSSKPFSTSSVVKSSGIRGLCRDT